MVCQILDHHLESSKIPCQIRHEVQVNTTDVDEANSSVGIKTPNIVDAQLKGVKLFHSIPPSQMAEWQKSCEQLSVIYECVANRKNLDCQRYTVLGQSLLDAYCYSLTIYF